MRDITVGLGLLVWTLSILSPVFRGYLVTVDEPCVEFLYARWKRCGRLGTAGHFDVRIAVLDHEPFRRRLSKLVWAENVTISVAASH